MAQIVEAVSRKTRAHRLAILIGLLFAGLALWYNFTLPIGESDNEVSHYRYIQYVKSHRDLPPTVYQWPAQPSADQCQGPLGADVQDSEHQFRQPPLYYVLTGVAFFWLDTSDTWWPPTNHYSIHSSHVDGGYNVAIHTPLEAFPYQGTTLAVRLIRMLSTLFGLIGLIAVYRTGRLIFRSRPTPLPALMMAAVGFVPTYTFAAAVINNDILVGALGLWCIYFCVRSILPEVRVRSFALATMCMVLAFLTKYNSVVLLPIVTLTGVVLLVKLWRLGNVRLNRSLRALGIIVALQTLLPAWWLLRNKQLYGDYFINYPNLVQPITTKISWLGAFSLPELVTRLTNGAKFTFMTFWGLLGADFVVLPQWLLTLLALMSGAIALGILYQWRARGDKRSVNQLAAVSLLVIVVNWWFLYFLINLQPARGRYLLPIFSVMGFLLIWGSSALRTRRFPWLGAYLGAGAIVAVGLFVPLGVLRPTYAPPPLATDAMLQPGEQPTHAYLGDIAELVGIKVEPQSVAPFEPVDVTLVWRALKLTSNNYVVGVHLMTVDKTYFGGAAHLPGKGNFATSLWKPGDIFRDNYRFYVQAAPPGKLPIAGQVKISMYCPNAQVESDVPVLDANGNVQGDAVYSTPIRIGLASTNLPPGEIGAPIARFGDEIALQQVTGTPPALRLGDEITLNFVWQALAPPHANYTLYLHLLDGQGNRLEGADRPLTQERYPSGMWLAGEVITDTHRIKVPVASLPAGAYQLVAGLYDPLTQERLPLIAEAAQATPDGLLLGAWEINLYRMYAPMVMTSPKAAPPRK